jgi:hypothetical protein
LPLAFACAAQVPLPDCWWEVFAVKLEDLCEVCRILHELYL